jgi:hypothetical protein
MKTSLKNRALSSRKAFTLTQAFLFILVMIASLVLPGCGANYEQSTDARDAVLADSVSSVLTSSAAKVGKGDSGHTFIRTADIRFSVKDVTGATFRIEDIVAKHNGYVSYTNLLSNVSYQSQTQVSEDSVMHAKHYQVENSLTIRVPNTHLDAALREIAPLMEFLDHRKITADDIKFTLMANQLAENRFNKHKERFTEAIDEKGKKMRETAEAENSLLMKQENADNTRIETLELMDQVNYSTVTLYIYQPETIQYTLVAKEKIIAPFKPSFLKRLGESVKTGWIVFEQIILFFVQIWGVIVLMIGLFFLIRWLVIYLSKPVLPKA